MKATRNRRILLRRRPVGEIETSDFEFEESDVPSIGERQVLVRNSYLSMDPAIRGWMSAAPSYIAPIALGDVVRSATLGEVVQSKISGIEPGERWVTLSGWEDYSAIGRSQLIYRLPDEPTLPLASYLNVLGGNGLTAYFGLLDIGRPKAGETVLVSAAAGGVGSIVGQIAKIRGCRAVGIAGSDEKCAWIVDEMGYDAAINYKTQKLRPAIKAACPKGVDVYFDNVGGPTLEAALSRINRGARIVICGAIATINSTERQPGPSNYIRLLTSRARMEGFITFDHADRFDEARAQISQWVEDGAIGYRDEIVEGFENIPAALKSLFSGGNRGKLSVRISEAQDVS
jgi:NADPH-dependent curcumin reductase CurA